MSFLPPRIKIEQPNENNFILQIKTRILYFVIIFFLALALLFFIVSLFIPYSINLTCDRHQNEPTSMVSCKLTTRNIWGIRKQNKEIQANSYQSVIKKVYLGNSNQPDYEVILLADNQKIKIANYSRFANNAWARKSQQINNFINGDDLNSVTVEENNASVIYTAIRWSFYMLVTAAIIWIVKINIVCTLSKESNTLSIRQYNGFTEQLQQASLDNIEKVILETSSDDIFTSIITFKLKSGEEIPLTSWLDSYEGKE